MVRAIALGLAIFAGCGGGATNPGPDLTAGPGDMAVPARDFAMEQLDLAWCTGAGGGGNSMMITSVTGKVVDEMGAPIDQLLTTVCAGTCYYGNTVADGTFSVKIGEAIDPAAFALAIHGRPGRVNYYLHLPPPANGLINFPSPLPLPPLPASGPLIATDKSAQTLTSGDLTLKIEAGTRVQLDVEDVALANMLGYQLRVLAVADPKTLPFVDALAPPAQLYGIAPFEAVFSHKVALSIANRSQLPAGAAVEVLEQRVLIACDPPAGSLVKVANAHVSGDGKTIDTDLGEGVSALSWIAVKAP